MSIIIHLAHLLSELIVLLLVLPIPILAFARLWQLLRPLISSSLSLLLSERPFICIVINL